jgi:hypothetical protein
MADHAIIGIVKMYVVKLRAEFFFLCLLESNFIVYSDFCRLLLGLLNCCVITFHSYFAHFCTRSVHLHTYLLNHTNN